MSSGKRPTGAAKGKQSDTEALCRPPPPPVDKHPEWPFERCGLLLGYSLGYFLHRKLLFRKLPWNSMFCTERV